MITVQKLGDRHDNSVVKIDQNEPGGNSAWHVSLTTPDLPPIFENSNNRQVEISIVGFKDINTDTTNTIFLPVVLTAIIQSDDKTKYYYRQRDEATAGGSLTPSMNLEGFVIMDKSEAKILEQPYAKLELTGSDDNKVQGNFSSDVGRQQFSGNSNQNGTQNMDNTNNTDANQGTEHVDANENANGGLNLPQGEQKSDTEAQKREEHHDYQQA